MDESAGQRWERQARRRRVVRDVATVGRSIASNVHQRFPERQWLRGVVSDVRFGDGEVAFELTTQQPDGTVASRLPVVLGSFAYEQVRRELGAAGLGPHHVFAVRQPVVVAGRLAYGDDDNRLWLRMDGIDLADTNELLGEAKDSVRTVLREENLFDRQRGLGVPGPPIRVGLVGQQSSSALADVRSTLTEGDFRTRNEVYPAPVEGNGAAAALADAIVKAARSSNFVIVARDPAPQALLAPFDAEPVARAVAVAGVPVITAVGSTEQPTLVEEVAFRAFDSPAEAARFAVGYLRESLLELERREARLRRAAYAALGRARAAHDERVGDLEQTKAEAAARLKAARARVRNGVLVVAAVAAAVLVGAYVAAEPPPWVPVVVVAAALLASLYVAWPLLRGRLGKRKESGVELEGMTFADALARLEELRDRLEDSTQPEQIERLMGEADEVSRYCRSLLGNAGEAIAAHERT